jgi:hypothetical protein
VQEAYGTLTIFPRSSNSFVSRSWTNVHVFYLILQALERRLPGRRKREHGDVDVPRRATKELCRGQQQGPLQRAHGQVQQAQQVKHQGSRLHARQQVGWVEYRMCVFLTGWSVFARWRFGQNFNVFKSSLLHRFKLKTVL